MILHLYPYNFSEPQFLLNTEGFSHEVFRYCGITNFRQKIVILCVSPPSLIHKTFWCENFCDTLKGSSTKLSLLWDKKNTAKLVTPPPLLFINFVDTRVFLIHKCFDYKVLRYCETTIFRRKTVILPLSLPLIQNIFRLSETQKGFSTKCFVTVRQNSFDKKSWYSPNSYHKFIWYQKFSETRKGSRTKFFGTLIQKFSNGK